MTHQPPIPDAQTPPWPATPAPRDHSAPAARAEEPGNGSKVSKGMVAAGVVAVGSAAVAAALMFAGRNSKPKTAAANPPPPQTPTQRTKPSAADIQVGDSD